VNVAPALAPGVVPSDTNTPTLHLPRIAPTGQPSRARQSEELLSRDIDERLATARRIVAERCLYGVDKNTMAVEMARLSLWLITLAKNKPFTFLDSNLRCGDSLLGVNLQQLQSLAMDAKDVRQMNFMEQAMERAITLTLNKRREISMHLEQSAIDADEKAHKLSSANDTMQLLKLGGDLLIAIALAEPKRRADLRNSLLYDYELLIVAAEDAHIHPLTAAEKQREHQQNIEKLRATTNDLLRERTPFHWPLEFPEVFAGGGAEAGFAAIVGNPPFQGGKKITGVLGTDYRDYMVKYLANNKNGSADLCAYFFLRAAALTRRNGMNALLATNTIAQGDTREVALDELTAANWTITRAIPSRKWSGEANLEVAYVWLWHGLWSGQIILNDLDVEGITPFLTIAGHAQGNPYKLEANQNEAFIGSVIGGIGFVVSPEEAQHLIRKEKKNEEVLFLYLNADDVNSRPDQSPSRWVINFHDWPLEQAEFYPHCMQIVREKVKPQRDNLNRKVYRERWWQYAEKCLTLYDTLKNLNTAWVIPRVSKYMICAQEPIDIVFSDATVVIASESKAYFALLQCTFHENWSRINGSSMRTDLRYTLTDCFQTFSFPPNMEQIEDIGERYYTHRQSIMLARQEGLTSTYNRFHNPAEYTSDIVHLRELHSEMDEAVARAYGWEDLRLEHGFHETKQGLRYTISEAARREVLDRLLLLNHERHAEEVAAGLVDESGKPPKGKAKGANGTQKGRRPGSGKIVAADGEGL